MEVTDYIKTEVTYTWNWETIKKLNGDWVEFILRDGTQVTGWFDFDVDGVYISSRYDTLRINLDPKDISSDRAYFTIIVLTAGKNKKGRCIKSGSYSDLVVTEKKEEFLKDKFIDDFSTLISNMVASRVTDDELDTIIRFTGMVLNNKTKASLDEALDDYPTVPKIFDKYINVKSMGSGITVDVAKLYCIKDPVTSHYFETGDGYFDAATAFKYLLKGKKVRQVDWTPDEYIRLYGPIDLIIDEWGLATNQNIILAGRDAKWELFKEEK